MPRIESVVQETNGKIDLAKVSTTRRHTQKIRTFHHFIDKNEGGWGGKLNFFSFTILSR